MPAHSGALSGPCGQSGAVHDVADVVRPAIDDAHQLDPLAEQGTAGCPASPDYPAFPHRHTVTTRTPRGQTVSVVSEADYT